MQSQERISNRKRRYIAHDKWAEYERRKRELYAMNLPPDEYEREIKNLTEELAI